MLYYLFFSYLFFYYIVNENSKRIPNLEMMEQIANVFGYTLDLNLVEKKEGKKSKDFYLEKSAKDIENMSKEDLVDYIFVTQSNNVIANICKTTLDMIELLPLMNIKELISKRIEGVDRLAIYFKLNEMYCDLEEEMAEFINHTKFHLRELSDLNEEIINKTEYIYLETYYTTDGCDYGEGYYYFDTIHLVDKNQNKLEADFNEINGYGYIVPLDDSLDNRLGEYLMEVSPGLIQLNY